MSCQALQQNPKILQNLNPSTLPHTMSSILTTDISTLIVYNVVPSNYGLQSQGDLIPGSAASECSSKTCSRLDSVLLEYKQFLAARIIQRQVRSWLSRRASRRENLAATTISRWWRGFNVRKKRYAVIEAELQGRVEKHYHKMATTVQALFRGWMTRTKYQDFQGMKELRMQYAEDLLSTLAKCLHKMKKDHLLPGIYGLRGSDLLNKIEGLSLTFGYRFHNGRMRAAIAQRQALLAKRRSEFRKAITYTPAPFPDPNSALNYQPDYYMPKTIGPQLQRVFLLYDKCNRDRYVRDILQKVSARLRNTMAMHREDIRHRFCKQLIRRTMRVTLEVPRHKRKSDMSQEFMDDLLDKIEEYNCNCRPIDPDNVLCV